MISQQINDVISLITEAIDIQLNPDLCELTFKNGEALTSRWLQNYDSLLLRKISAFKEILRSKPDAFKNAISEIDFEFSDLSTDAEPTNF